MIGSQLSEPDLGSGLLRFLLFLPTGLGGRIHRRGFRGSGDQSSQVLEESGALVLGQAGQQSLVHFGRSRTGGVEAFASRLRQTDLFGAGVRGGPAALQKAPLGQPRDKLGQGGAVHSGGSDQLGLGGAIFGCDGFEDRMLAGSQGSRAGP